MNTSDPTSTLLPRSDRWPLALAILYSGLIAVRLASLAPPASLTFDDGFYYLGIARNLAQGFGSTWDGLHSTNGYHPLWLLALVPIYRLAPSPEVALWAVFALQAVLLAAAAGLLYLVCRRCADPGSTVPENAGSRGSSPAGLPRGDAAGAGLAVLFWLGLSYRLMFSGLEYGLSVVSLLLVAYAWLRLPRESPGVRAHLALGLLLALAFLARVETLMLGALIVWSLLRRPQGSRPESARRLAALICPPLAVATGYMMLSWQVFGHPAPISGGLKAGWSQLALEQDHLFQHGGLVAKVANLFWPLHPPFGVWSLTIAAGSLGIPLLWLARRRLRLTGLESLKPIIAFSCLSYLTYAVIYHGMWSRTAWYYAIQPVLAAILAAAMLEAWTPKARRRWRTAMMTLIAAGLILRTLGGIEKHRPTAGAGIEPVLEALAELPEDAVLASWNGGALGYLSGRPVISLDGLVNSHRYALSGRWDLCRYWHEEGITHLVDAFDLTRAPDVRPLFPGYPELHDFHACRDRLRLIWSDRRTASTARAAIFELHKEPDRARTAEGRGMG